MSTENFEDLIRRLRQLGPFADDDAAASTLLVVLAGMSHALVSSERDVLASSLPAEAAAVLTHREPMRVCTLESLVKDIARREGVADGLAVERLELVGRAIFEVLTPQGRALLSRALPFLPPLLEPRSVAELPPSATERAMAARDLAEGHEGGRHPLASSDPQRLAHRHSIARADDPHGESKLSSARGLSQEREQETLASGRPGSRRPLSSSH